MERIDKFRDVLISSEVVKKYCSLVVHSFTNETVLTQYKKTEYNGAKSGEYVNEY